MSNCPCCSNKKYNECCSRYINDHILPETPEQLMRSRYTAYTEANIDYILETMKAPASNGFDKESAKEWATSVKWLGLEVIKNSMDNSLKGYVEFKAHFKEQGRKNDIHEISEFHRIDGRWYYVDGNYDPKK